MTEQYLNDLRQTMPEPPKKKRRSIWTIVGIVAGVVLLTALIAAIAGPPRVSTAAPVPAQEPTTITVTAEPTAATPPVTVTAQPPAPMPAPPSTPATHTVVYKLTGNVAAVKSLSYTNGTGGTTQKSDVAVPLLSEDGTEGLTFTVQPGSFLYFTAGVDFVSSTDADSLTCTIEVDGVVVDSSTSEGKYAYPSCMSSVGF